MAKEVLGGVDPLEILNGAIWTLLALFALFIVVRVLARKKDATTWKYGDVELSTREWLPICALLAIFAVFSRPVWEAISRSWAEASIATPEPERLSVVIPEFGGPGGVEAAETLKLMLQSALGSGVQVLTVPSLPAPPRYGDASAANDKLSGASLFCAARYNADVVVWGTYLPSTNMLSVNYTAKSDKCFPSNCGRIGSRYPTLYALDDARNQSSALATMLTGSVVTALEMGTDHDGEGAAAGACLDDPATARTFAAKANSLLKGQPRGLDPDRLSVVAGYAALFQRKLFDHSKSIGDLDRAISVLAEASAKYPKYGSRSAGFLSTLLAERGSLSTDQSELLRLAQRIETLLPMAEKRDQAGIRSQAAALVESAFYMGPTAEILARVETYHRTRLEDASLSGAERLHHLIRIAGARTEYFDEDRGPERHSLAVRSMTPVYDMLNAAPSLEKQIRAGDRCTLARSDLILATPHLSPGPLADALNRARRLVDEDNADWSNAHCADAYHGLSDNFSRMSKHARGADAVELLRLGVHFEHIVNARDKAHAPYYNRFHLAIAAAKLAKASRDGKERHEALQLLSQARQDAITYQDPIARKTMDRLEAEIRGS